MNEITPADILSRIRELNQTPEVTPPSPTQGSFATTLTESIEDVSRMQHEANNLAVKFQTGDESTSVVDVMLASQKASIAFHATAEVRNKLVTAYQEIMNMPV